MPSNAQHETQVGAVEQEVFEGLSIAWTPAPLWRRTFAYCVDMGLLTLISYIGILALFFIFGALFVGFTTFLGTLPEKISKLGEGSGAIIGILLIAVAVLAFMSIFHIYFVYFEYKNGATPGKKLFGLKVLSINGARLGKAQCWIREIFRYLDNLLIPALVAWGMTDRRQRIGDLASGCMVIWSPSAEKSQSFLYYVEVLKPRLMLPHERKKVLEICYPLFVTKKHNQVSELVLSQLEDFADSVFQGKIPENFKREWKMRFLAEHCLQDSIENNVLSPESPIAK